MRARFKREAAALSLLRHPGIVAAHDFGEVDGDLYIVMEFVRGHSLADEIADATHGMDYATITTILEQVLQVVEAAHEARVVHRDLKPENVMLLDAHDRAAHVKVLDFGIALMDDREGDARLTETNAVQGTPLYMSPEQCRGRNVGPPTDVYAIGAILYEMLAGDTCFKGDSLVDVMAQHMFVLPPPIAERGLKRAVPPELERLAMWALSKKPEDRPTATQLRDALANALRGAGALQLAASATEERIRAMGLTRNERGLPAVSPALAQTVGVGALDEKDRPVVFLWGFVGQRGEDLRSTLAVNGVDAKTWSGADLSTASSARAIVVAPVRAVERVEALRAVPALAHTPVLAVDVASAPILRRSSGPARATSGSRRSETTFSARNCGDF